METSKRMFVVLATILVLEASADDYSYQPSVVPANNINNYQYASQPQANFGNFNGYQNTQTPYFQPNSANQPGTNINKFDTNNAFQSTLGLSNLKELKPDLNDDKNYMPFRQQTTFPALNENRFQNAQTPLFQRNMAQQPDININFSTYETNSGVQSHDTLNQPPPTVQALYNNNYGSKPPLQHFNGNAPPGQYQQEIRGNSGKHINTISIPLDLGSQNVKEVHLPIPNKNIKYNPIYVSQPKSDIQDSVVQKIKPAELPVLKTFPGNQNPSYLNMAPIRNNFGNSLQDTSVFSSNSYGAMSLADQKIPNAITVGEQQVMNVLKADGITSNNYGGPNYLASLPSDTKENEYIPPANVESKYEPYQLYGNSQKGSFPPYSPNQISTTSSSTSAMINIQDKYNSQNNLDVPSTYPNNLSKNNPPVINKINQPQQTNPFTPQYPSIINTANSALPLQNNYDVWKPNLKESNFPIQHVTDFAAASTVTSSTHNAAIEPSPFNILPYNSNQQTARVSNQPSYLSLGVNRPLNSYQQFTKDSVSAINVQSDRYTTKYASLNPNVSSNQNSPAYTLPAILNKVPASAPINNDQNPWLYQSNKNGTQNIETVSSASANIQSGTTNVDIYPNRHNNYISTLNIQQPGRSGQTYEPLNPISNNQKYPTFILPAVSTGMPATPAQNYKKPWMYPGNAIPAHNAISSTSADFNAQTGTTNLNSDSNNSYKFDNSAYLPLYKKNNDYQPPIMPTNLNTDNKVLSLTENIPSTSKNPHSSHETHRNYSPLDISNILLNDKNTFSTSESIIDDIPTPYSNGFNHINTISSPLPQNSQNNDFYKSDMTNYPLLTPYNDIQNSTVTSILQTQNLSNTTGNVQTGLTNSSTFVDQKPDTAEADSLGYLQNIESPNSKNNANNGAAIPQVQTSSDTKTTLLPMPANTPINEDNYNNDGYGISPQNNHYKGSKFPAALAWSPYLSNNPNTNKLNTIYNNDMASSNMYNDVGTTPYSYDLEKNKTSNIIDNSESYKDKNINLITPIDSTDAEPAAYEGDNTIRTTSSVYDDYAQTTQTPTYNSNDENIPLHYKNIDNMDVVSTTLAPNVQQDEYGTVPPNGFDDSQTQSPLTLSNNNANGTNFSNDERNVENNPLTQISVSETKNESNMVQNVNYLPNRRKHRKYLRRGRPSTWWKKRRRAYRNRITTPTESPTVNFANTDITNDNPGTETTNLSILPNKNDLNDDNINAGDTIAATTQYPYDNTYQSTTAPRDASPYDNNGDGQHSYNIQYQSTTPPGDASLYNNYNYGDGQPSYINQYQYTTNAPIDPNGPQAFYNDYGYGSTNPQNIGQTDSNFQLPTNYNNYGDYVDQPAFIQPFRGDGPSETENGAPELYSASKPDDGSGSYKPESSVAAGSNPDYGSDPEYGPLPTATNTDLDGVEYRGSYSATASNTDGQNADSESLTDAFPNAASGSNAAEGPSAASESYSNGPIVASEANAVVGSDNNAGSNANANSATGSGTPTGYSSLSASPAHQNSGSTASKDASTDTPVARAVASVLRILDSIEKLLTGKCNDNLIVLD